MLTGMRSRCIDTSLPALYGRRDGVQNSGIPGKHSAELLTT